VPKTPRRERGQLEREVLAVVAAADHPLTPRDVVARLGQPLAYTTVMSTLARLHDKGALSRHPAGRAHAYAVVASPDGIEAALTARQMTRLLDGGADRALALARFVAELRPEDEQLLIDLLADHPPPDGARPQHEP
jgi:predicted transcriptional regulator